MSVRSFIPISQNEINNILDSKSPSTDLKVNSEGKISKRNLLSKVLYSLGYRTEKSDTELKRRIGEIVEQLMLDVGQEAGKVSERLWSQISDDRAQKVGETREITDIFLEKVGMLKPAQFDRNKFGKLFNIGKRKKFVAELREFSKRMDQMNDSAEIKTEAANAYDRMIGQIIVLDYMRDDLKATLDLLRHKKRDLDLFPNNDIVELRKKINSSLQDAIREIEPPKREIALFIDSKFHLREKNEFKTMFVEVLKKSKDINDAEEIARLMLANYDKVNIAIGKLLEERTDPDLEALREDILFRKNKLRAMPNPTKEELLDIIQYDVLEAKTASKIAKMNFLFQLGVHGSSEKGVTGTILVKDLSKRILGVFKPDASYAPIATKIKNLFRSVWGQLSLLPKKENAQPTAEYVSYRVDRFFGIKSVPSSKPTVLGGAKGVFQLAAGTAKKTRNLESESSVKIGKRLKEAKDVTAILNKSSFSNPELEIFQRFAILDFLIGNLDAHEENWFIDTSEGEITGIIGIDKANSWMEKNPEPGDRRSHNQYKWNEMGIANHSFTPSMRKLMVSITEKQVMKFIEEMERQTPGFFDDNIAKLALERAKAIRIIAETPGSTPADLAKIRSDSDFEQLFASSENKERI